MYIHYIYINTHTHVCQHTHTHTHTHKRTCWATCSRRLLTTDSLLASSRITSSTFPEPPPNPSSACFRSVWARAL